MGEKKRGALVLLIGVVSFVLVLNSLVLVQATEMGVNYYHESMISGKWGTHYIERSLPEVEKDMEFISNFTKYVKFYYNPYAGGNLEWVVQLTDVAKQKGLHVVVATNVDDRTLNWNNKDEYYRLVREAAFELNGKADEFIVGNEIALHTDMQRSEIRSYAEPLIKEVELIFDGPVSYEIFWWAKDSWEGYEGKLYVNMYEGYDTFCSNLNELENFHEPIIGEWGEDYTDESISSFMGEEWQDEELKKRWNEIQNTSVDVAYIFAFREPSYDGFGILDGDRVKGFLDYFLESQPSTQIQNLYENFTVDNVEVNLEGANVVEDIVTGDCRNIKFDLLGIFKILMCQKSTNLIEAYLQEYPENSGWFEISVQDDSLNKNKGFTKIEGNQTQEIIEPEEPIESNSGINNVAELSFNINQEYNLVLDNTEGDCRIVEFSLNEGNGKILICKKGDYYFEAYRQEFPYSNAVVDIQGESLSKDKGFASIDTNNIEESQIVQETKTQISIDSLDYSFQSNDEWHFVDDAVYGSCREVKFKTSKGEVIIKTCEKAPNYFEVYRHKYPSDLEFRACFETACISSYSGFSVLKL